MDCELFMLDFEKDSLDLKLEEAIVDLRKVSAGATTLCEGTQYVPAPKQGALERAYGVVDEDLPRKLGRRNYNGTAAKKRKIIGGFVTWLVAYLKRSTYFVIRRYLAERDAKDQLTEDMLHAHQRILTDFCNEYDVLPV